LLSEFCGCCENVAFESKCEKCSPLLQDEKKNWEEIYKIMEVKKKERKKLNDD
jgi:hypothetical protein